MSGRKRDKSKARLFQLLQEKALFRGRITLSSGRASGYYFDARLVSLSPQGAYLIADVMLGILKGKKIDAVGGPTLGADPIVGAIAALSYIRKQPLNTFIVRNSAKEHGRMRQVEGAALRKNNKVVLVDDVVTTGGSLINAKKILNKQGVKVDSAIVLIDRQEGAQANLARHGLKLTPVFKASDFGL